MKRANRYLGLWAVVLVMALAACQNTSPNVSQDTMPVYTINQNGPTASQASALASALGAKGLSVESDGVIRFVDEQRFQHVPVIDMPAGQPDEEGSATTQQAIDLKGVLQLGEYDPATAVDRAKAALDSAGLGGGTGPIGFQAEPGHTTFEMVDGSGSTLASKPIDTQVNYAFELGGRDLVGPGARIKVVFDTQGMPARVHYALPAVSKGGDAPIISTQQAGELAQQSLRQQAAQQHLVGTLQVGDPTLVYYVPPPSLGAKTIYPYYKVGGSIVVGGETVPLRDTLLPAVQNAPQVDISMSVDTSGDPQVTAKADVNGGTPPYTYQWSSSSTTLDPSTATSGPSVTYAPDLYTRDQAAVNDETVNVVVTDANGLTVEGSATAPLQAASLGGRAAPAGLSPMVTGPIDVGTEWIGNCAGLGGSSGNAGGFVQVMRNHGVTIRFNWGNSSAWEQDFKDPSKGGNDTNYADNADFVFYTGHANGNGFVFCNNAHDDTFLNYSDASWGQNDLEWLTIAACGPLQLDSGGKAWYQRWGPAFDGLHLLMGYATVTYDNQREGKLLAKYALGDKGAARPLREAWALTATDVQSESEIWSVMGVYGSSYVSDFNDHFHGQGSVGPDLRGSDIRGYWLMRGPS